jgi:pimeloyl-ACP methyl ester carboxylesterase
VGTFGRRLVVTGVAATALISVASCARNEALRSEAIATSTAVSFTTSDGVRLDGRLFGPAGATAGVVLAHMLPADQTAWYTYAARLADTGYRVLTFDFRGYCPGGDGGCSQGSKDPGVAGVDLAAALEYVRGQGTQRVGLVGASMGGTAALVVASQEQDAVQAVVTLSAPPSIDSLVAGPDVLQEVTAAKLFIAGLEDTTAAVAAKTFFDESLQPKRYEILTTGDHGTDILDGNQGERAKDLISAWIEVHVPLTPPSGAGP